MINLSFWRFVIHLNFAKSLLWTKNGDTYIFHIGLFSNGVDTGLKVILLPINLKVGFVRR